MNLYLIAIGINCYSDSDIQNLRFAENDAKAVFDVFKNAVEPANFHGTLLTGSEATLSQIKLHAGELVPELAAANDSVLIYFAGHGAVEVLPSSSGRANSSNYLVPYDANHKRLYSSAFSLTKELSILAERIASEHLTIILDCCFSGASGSISARGIDGYYFGLDKLISRIDPTSRIVGSGGTSLDVGIGRVVFMASGPEQAAFEDATLQHGIYTHFLVQELAGWALPGPISSALLHNSVSDAVKNYTGGTQIPVLEGRMQGHNIL